MAKILHPLAEVAPEDYEIIGLYGILNPFKGRLALVRAAAKLAWRYALLMEIGCALRNHFKFAQINGISRADGQAIQPKY